MLWHHRPGGARKLSQQPGGLQEYAQTHSKHAPGNKARQVSPLVDDGTTHSAEATPTNGTPRANLAIVTVLKVERWMCREGCSGSEVEQRRPKMYILAVSG
jgi:hypothetical protein